MAYETIIYEKLGRIGRVTLNRPEKLNAISEQLRREYEDAVFAAEADDEVRVVIVRGAGRAFCAGYDLSGQGQQGYVAPTVFDDWRRNRHGTDRWLRIWGIAKPLIAQVHGYCLAGGNELAGTCDLIIAAEDAQFGHPAGRMLGIPDTLALWPMIIGMRKTKELLFTGKSVSGKDAERIGMVNLAVPAAKLESTVMDWAETISQVPLEALAEHKFIVNRWFEIMGLRTAASEGGDYDTIYHQTEPAKEWRRLVQEHGLKRALEIRDAPFRDYRGKGR